MGDGTGQGRERGGGGEMGQGRRWEGGRDETGEGTERGGGRPNSKDLSPKFWNFFKTVRKQSTFQFVAEGDTALKKALKHEQGSVSKASSGQFQRCRYR